MIQNFCTAHAVDCLLVFMQLETWKSNRNKAENIDKYVL